MLQACLNGSRTRQDHPATPYTPAELAAEAERVVQAGAHELHFHPRNERGDQTLEPEQIAAALQAVRARLSGIPLGLSTSDLIPTGGAQRRELFARWRVLPDYVSVNLIEDDAPEVISLMLAIGVGIEAGLGSAAEADRFVRLPEAVRCRRVLIEIEKPTIETGIVVANDILAVLDRAGLRLPVLLHGYDATMWTFYQEALARGFDRRIRLEDGLLLPTGEIAAGNEELIQTAVRLAPPEELPPDAPAGR